VLLFRILSRSSGPVPPGEQGYKDIVALAPDESATLLVHFDGLSGKHYYHCHVYEHEDRGMMGT
jgi:FtsP/CotA-like multicopper oxidase with cupredoxin domain